MAEINELEMQGAALFERMGLTCCWNLEDAPLVRLNPSGSYRRGDHLEVDYLLPQSDVCLVGEITDRAAGKCPDKLKTFQSHLNTIDHAIKAARNHEQHTAIWKTLGVADGNLRLFRNIRSLRGFCILTKNEEFEIPPQMPIDNCIVLYRYHWDLLNEYAETIGHWARYPFFDMFGLSRPGRGVSRPLRFSAEGGNMLATCDRYVTEDRQNESHVVTFHANPYHLLPCAEVCRRDVLPSLDASRLQRYQRSLFASKLTDIRKRLLTTPRFIFPNSILAVLSQKCRFDSSSKSLEIPDDYGAIRIIDGQHRLFSYASEEVRRLVGEDTQIAVTGIVFDSVDQEYIDRFSSRTFIEINTNQTRVSNLHLYGIGYEFLGEKTQKYLAAHILRIVNVRKNKLRGLLRTSDSPRGRIQSMEIVGSLGVITSIEKMERLQSATGRSAMRRRQGFQELFGQPVEDLSLPQNMVVSGINTIERYFNLVAKIFEYDWPSPGGADNGSCFNLTKFFAALVGLLARFIDEGMSWADVESELLGVRANILKLRERRTYTSMLFALSDSKIPDATIRISDMLRFLDANRRRPTSIASVKRAASVTPVKRGH